MSREVVSMDMKQQRFGIEIEHYGGSQDRGAELQLPILAPSPTMKEPYYVHYVALDPPGRMEIHE